MFSAVGSAASIKTEATALSNGGFESIHPLLVLVTVVSPTVHELNTMGLAWKVKQVAIARRRIRHIHASFGRQMRVGRKPY
jgi:hypothetical protein